MTLFSTVTKFSKWRITSCWLWLAVTLGLVAEAAADDDRLVDFNRQIRPLLSDKCFRCHGPDAEHREADLRLDTQEGAENAVVAGDLDASPLWERISSDDEDLRMPPADSGKELSPAEIQLLKQWIQQGATWSKAWAYVPPRRHPVPNIQNDQWSINWIDRFLMERFREEQIEPAKVADRVTLIRRLHFDLTGLPPTVAQVQAFVNDSRPDAFERRVDELLSSVHFGERMAIYWLDLVRFADTVGYHGDQDHNISPYRDYVIDALNSNVPFDQFTREQLAGDLLPDPTNQQLVATGYNRLLQTSHEGGVQPKEYLAIYAADRVRNVSAVWLGATLGCAQCHDHKYDPFTTQDFYSMVSFFADLDEAQHFKTGSNSLPTARPPEIAVLSGREQRLLDSWKADVKRYEQQLSSVKDDDARAKIQQQKERAEKRCAEIESSKRKSMISVAIQPRTIRLLPRGNWLDDSGPVMQPAAPKFMGSVAASSDRPTRLDLANWLTEADQVGSLTARVMANRLWYLFFGHGLARRLDDFGGQGEAPDHPQLLDQLAVEFVDSQWDMKHLIRSIVTSQAYRQSSLTSDDVLRRDPDNRWFARQTRQRLPAEMVRDQVLSVSHLLNREIGGRSIKPYQPAGYYRHLNFPKRAYKHDQGPQQHRRGLYVHWQRQFLHPMMRALDAPSREECTAERPQSNTPNAALVLLNDPTFVEAARHFAARVLDQPLTTDQHKITFAFQEVVSREPDAYERKILTDLLEASREEYRQHPKYAEQLIQDVRNQGRASAAEQAAWTMVCRALLNLGEAVTRY